jgi:hypothetical protein
MANETLGSTMSQRFSSLPTAGTLNKQLDNRQLTVSSVDIQPVGQSKNQIRRSRSCYAQEAPREAVFHSLGVQLKALMLGTFRSAEKSRGYFPYPAPRNINSHFVQR